MAKRGRKELPLEQITSRKWQRERAARAALAGGPVAREWPESPTRPPLPPTADAWATLLRLLPGYDPFALAPFGDGGAMRFDEPRALRALDYIEGHDGSEGRKAQRGLRFTEGARAGQLVRLEEWQRSFVANLFGWVRADGTRRYRRAFLYIGSGNGKSCLASMIAAYMFEEETEAGAQVLTAATKREQAGIVWRHACLMLQQPTDWAARFQMLQARARRAPDDGSLLMPVSADAGTEDGLSATCVLFDELHRQNDTTLLNVLSKSQKKRREPVFIYLSTADTDRVSPCNDEVRMAREIRDNRGDPTAPGFNPYYLPALYECDEKDDPKDESKWRKANPCLGVSKSAAGMREDLVEALAKGAADLDDWVRYHLNIVRKSSSAFIPMEAWDRCAEPFDPAILVGHGPILALDLSATTDIEAAVLHAVIGETHYVVGRYWVAETAWKGRDLKNDTTYRRWSEAGHLTLTDGDVIDDEQVIAEIMEWIAPFKVREIALDPWNALRYSNALQSKGFSVVAVRQGVFTQNEPLKFLVQLVSKGRLRHGGDPVLRWMAKNADREVDKKGNWGLVKPRGDAKIDGIAALVTALARYFVRAPAVPTPGAFVLPLARAVPDDDGEFSE